MFMHQPRGKRPKRKRPNSDNPARRKVNEEAVLAAVVAPFAGLGILLGTRSLLDSAVFTAFAFLVAFCVFTVLRIVVALPERGRGN